MNKFVACGVMMAGLLLGSAPEAAAEPVAVTGDKVGVVYFSWSRTGNTRFAAETIAKKIGTKPFEIKAAKPYGTHYNACFAEAKPECATGKLRPIQPVVGLDPAKYDVIFIGTPNWFGTIAPPVRTFLVQNAAVLKGKTVCLFQTNGGGGMQNCGKDFAQVLPNSKVLPAQAFKGATIRSQVSALEQFVAERITVK